MVYAPVTHRKTHSADLRHEKASVLRINVLHVVDKSELAFEWTNTQRDACTINVFITQKIYARRTCVRNMLGVC